MAFAIVILSADFKSAPTVSPNAIPFLINGITLMLKNRKQYVIIRV